MFWEGPLCELHGLLRCVTATYCECAGGWGWPQPSWLPGSTWCSGCRSNGQARTGPGMTGCRAYGCSGLVPACWWVGKTPRANKLERALQNGTYQHSSTPAWKIPWMEELGRLQSMGSLRVRHDWATSLSLFTFVHWRRKWQPTAVFLPGESQGRGSLVGCCLWGLTESDTTEAT